jgi:hypothetical protein
MTDYQGYKKQRQILELASGTKQQPYLTGGFAEDAVLYHKPSRRHSDIDWFMLRDDLEHYQMLAERLGFETINTYGTDASGQPFYMSCTADESLWIDFAIADRDSDGNPYVEVAELLFDTSGLPPLKPIRIYFDRDILNYPVTEFDGLEVQTVSPIGLYQLRAGLNVYKTFGELRETDIKSMADLKSQFFADRDDADLMPRVAPL